LPHRDEHPDEASILPEPDLNPLLNPLLGQNMGRWAEVYFTSAPEKREEALQDLLRELQAENDAREAALQVPAAEQASLPLENADEIAGKQNALVRCPACGRENPASHRFCGMCGTAVLQRSAVNDPRMSDRHTTDFIVADLDAARLDLPKSDPADLDPVSVPTEDRLFKYRGDEPSRHESTQHESVPHELAPAATGNVESNQSRFATSEHAPFESPMRANESPQPSRDREEAYHADQTMPFFDAEPASSSYRVPLAITLALVLLALGYFMWRSMQAADSSRVAAPAAQSATSMSAPVPPAPSTPASSTTDTPKTHASKTDPSKTDTPKIDTPDGISPAANQAVTTASPVPASDSANKVAHAKGPYSRSAQTTLIPKQKSPSETVSGSGGEELATAQRYLNGAPGLERNSTEAAKWLWKAIAKHNGEASLLLSDLYLKGDGVGKNCDQARVLLDAAAVKGVQGAAERLRHLQAFGCS
jgi:hypothetical protein